jgi:CRISPR/Cas system-associated exonuclease Cas4 (RecB family)
MNEQNIDDIISALYDMVQDARALPLGADKCILERDKVLDMLDEIIAQLPVELKQARTIVDSRNELIGQARREAENLIRQAQEQAAQLVAEEAIYQEAKRQCQEMVLQTQTRMAELRKASNDYMDDALRRTEEAIAMSLEDVRDTRTKFKALVEAQDKRANAAPEAEEEA